MVLQKSSSSPSMVFKVRRNPTELVAPAGPTPHELKLLSDIDDQQGLRIYYSAVQFFPYSSSMAGKDPIPVIRQALSKVLVLYYPLAGRLRKGPSGKLMVDCTAEGVLFIEADADVTLDHFGVDLLPPFPCFDELLHHVPSSNDGIINSPLLLIQVTRLKCGGFIFAIRVNHTMCDAIGITQFIKAVAEIAQGASKPSIMPVWCRDLLCARDPPTVTSLHPEYHQPPLHHHNKNVFSSKSCHASFFFGPKQIHALRRLLPGDLAQSSSTFEVLTAFLWRCYTATLHYQNPNQEVRLMCVVNIRSTFNHPLPEGYYGNAFVIPAIVSTVEMLCNRPLSYALKLAKKSKKAATEEYFHSTADLMATNGRPAFNMTESFIVSDLTKCGLSDVDYGGWGNPLYSGLDGLDDVPGACYYVPYTNSKRENGKEVLICLPGEAMKRDFLCARDPPRVTCLHPEYHQPPLHDNKNFSSKSCDASFFFGPKHIDTLRRLLRSHHAQSSSTFDILTAFLLHCHTAALHSQNPNHQEALELAKKQKKEATEEYDVRSTTDLMATKGRPGISLRTSFIVSNVSKLGLSEVDYGWGKPLYIGPDKVGIHDIPSLCYYLPYTNSKGEHGIVVLICLPEDAMKRFENVLNGILHIEGSEDNKPINSIMSNL
ncbi:hypothetical protein PIB30_055907 [Stylosanthes scabra]|uniref:Uncharacterized protein n=1 Tax=Stylosanthes scabra TaxID=79078 RepID=A0ABU6SJW9_9FABA|nr:hypothetical protein [Stylosanthes scabra]